MKFNVSARYAVYAVIEVHAESAEEADCLVENMLDVEPEVFLERAETTNREFGISNVEKA